jgi:cell division protein ZapA (FtsZ GTPase activity inhibitor)
MDENHQSNHREALKMKNILIILVLVVILAAAWYLFVYEKPGALEKAGQSVDQTIDKIKHGDETTMEKATRKTKEAVEDMKQDSDK